MDGSQAPSPAPTGTNPLLAGVRVLDLTRLLPGPFCTLYLAQLGAEVIKIEEPGGEYGRQMPELFAQLQRGKTGLTLDLRIAADRERFVELAATADVVIESFRPGVMDALGCGYETLSRRNPRLVYAALTGYGQTGPYRDRAGHDLNYLATAGVLDQMGSGAPAMANVQIADLAGGSLNCAIGILAALLGARASGVGTMVDVAMLDGALALQAVPLASLRARGRTPKRGADLLSGALPNYRVYRCRGGEYLAVGALESKFFVGLLRVLFQDVPLLRRLLPPQPGDRSMQPDAQGQGARRQQRVLADPERAARALAPVHVVLALIFRCGRRDRWAARFASADVCVSAVLTLEEALANEQVRARGMLVDDGGKPAFALPIRFARPEAMAGQQLPCARSSA